MIGLPFSFLAYGSDINVRQSNLYPYQSTVALQDDFIVGINGSGTTGTLGWVIAGGATTNLVSETNRPGILRRDTSAVINTTAYLVLYGSSSAINGGDSHSVIWIERLNTNDANTTINIGSANTAFTAAPSSGIYFQKLDADTNWFCVTRSGGVQTRTDSGIAVNTSFNTFYYNKNSSGVTWKINNTSVCGTHTTNIPSSFIDPNTVIVNSAAASKTVDVDYFQLVYNGLTR